MKSKYGFVALLDALGTKTATLGQAEHYLNHIKTIEKDIKQILKVTFSTLKDHELNRNIFDILSIRFFGDTLLITYEIKDIEKEADYFSRISFILRLFICKALDLGFMFRGSLSLGDYVDNGPVVLGPAISDAATWYEKLDMIGVILTPHATLALKSILSKRYKGGHKSDAWSKDFIIGGHPIKDCKDSKLELFALNWPQSIQIYSGRTDDEQWFYETMRKFPMPSGVETKFTNTELFFHKSKAIESDIAKPNKQKLGTG